MSYTDNLMTNLLATCPFGYIKRTGSIPGRDGELILPSKITKTECMNACSLKDSCLSFQHSASKMRCNLNELALPIFAHDEDYVFCSKNGNIS